jgi:hypothetical protein
MSGCNMLNRQQHVQLQQVRNRRQHVRLQHARTEGNISTCNMLEQAVTCPDATCSNRFHLHTAFCYNWSFVWSP